MTIFYLTIAVILIGFILMLVPDIINRIRKK